MIMKFTGKLAYLTLIKLLVINIGIMIEGQIIGVQKSPQIEQVSSQMRGGHLMKKENFPWFAFIRIGFPHFDWKYWDEKVDQIKTKSFSKSISFVLRCSGVWVTVKHVLTADHCFWLKRPKYHSFGSGDPKGNTERVFYFKNMIEDESTYTDKDTKKKVKRGNLQNIAVKLYGNDFGNAHPKKATAENNGIFKPWFRMSYKAFKVKRYNYLDGGVNAAKTGSFTAKSVDLAVLTLYESVITAYFNNLPLSLSTDVFDRLKWVKHKEDKLTITMETIWIGAGKRSKTARNPLQQAFITKEYMQKSKSSCKKNIPWYNNGWTLCMVNRMGENHDKILPGDSGGPIFTEIEDENATPDDKKKYRLHGIHSGKHLVKTDHWSIITSVERKKKKILGLIS